MLSQTDVVILETKRNWYHFIFLQLVKEGRRFVNKNLGNRWGFCFSFFFFFLDTTESIGKSTCPLDKADSRMSPEEWHCSTLQCFDRNSGVNVFHESMVLFCSIQSFERKSTEERKRLQVELLLNQW